MHARLRLLAALTAVVVLWLVPAGAEAKVVWLCKPGQKANPCEPSLRTTLYTATGKRLGVENVRRSKRRRIDCFYVYPTASDQPGPQATKVVDDVLRSIALYQAARYSSECRVYAPVYRQFTVQGLLNPSTITATMREQGYADVREAWRRYLRRFNHGRGVVLIGHSQGTFVLRRLISEEIDPRRAIRRKVVSAILLGGNVLVKKGSDRGGDLKKMRACRRARQTGCIVAFSAFGETPPANALFGRTTRPDREVLCTNPRALGGGPAPLTATYPTKPFAASVIGAAANLAVSGLPHPNTPWVTVASASSGRCSRAGGASVLRITPRGNVFKLTATPDATWGFHLADANVALDDLVQLVRRQARAF
jgi:hypothetical protein